MRHASEESAPQVRDTLRDWGLWATYARAGTLLRGWGQWRDPRRIRNTPEEVQLIDNPC